MSTGTNEELSFIIQSPSGTGGAPAFTAEPANKIFAGPTSGADALPNFRSLVSADIAGLIPPSQPLLWIIKTTTYTAVSGDKIAADTSGGVFTVTLPPTPSVGDNVELVDASNSWETNNLTVGRNGQSIGGSATNLSCDTPLRTLLIFVGGSIGWGVY